MNIKAAIAAPKYVTFYFMCLLAAYTVKFYHILSVHCTLFGIWTLVVTPELHIINLILFLVALLLHTR